MRAFENNKRRPIGLAQNRWSFRPLGNYTGKNSASLIGDVAYFMQSFMTKLSRTRLNVFAIVLACLAAWVVQLRDYLPIADDFPNATAFGGGMWDTIWSLYAATGIRRSFALLSNMPICAAPVEITNALCLTLHFAATALLFGVANVLSRMPRLAFAVAVLFGVFPFGYGAVTWASGSYIIPCLIFFLAALAILLRHAGRPLGPDWVMAVVSGHLVFIGCIVGEHLVFASALVGALALASTGKALCFQDLKKPWVVAPALAVGLYLVLVLATQSGATLTDIRGEARSLSTINPPTVLSVWFYQVRNFDYFQPWLQSDAVRLALLDIGWLRVLGGSILLMGVWACFLRAHSRNLLPARDIEQTGEPSHLNMGHVPLVLVLAMMIGLSAVHALAGGYSASSRHQYAPLALLALLAAVVGTRYPLFDRLLAWRSSLPLVLLVLLGAATTWLVTGLNHFELRRHHALIDFLAKENIGGPVRLQFAPPLDSYWPKMRRTLGGYAFDDEWVLNLALEDRKAAPITISSNSVATTVRVTWNGVANVVEVVPQ